MPLNLPEKPLLDGLTSGLRFNQQLPGPDQQRPGGDGPLRDAAPDPGGTRAPASRRRQSQPESWSRPSCTTSAGCTSSSPRPSWANHGSTIIRTSALQDVFEAGPTGPEAPLVGNCEDEAMGSQSFNEKWANYYNHVVVQCTTFFFGNFVNVFKTCILKMMNHFCWFIWPRSIHSYHMTRKQFRPRWWV